MKRRTVFFVILGLVVVLPAAFMLAGRDIPPPDVSDLAVVRPELLPEENAYTYYLAATNELNGLLESKDVLRDYLAGEEVDEEALSDLIEQNGASVAWIRQGNACERCITLEVKDFSTTLPFIRPWLEMGRLLAAKTRHDRLAGRYDEAVNSCVTQLQFADRIQSDAESIIIYLIGVGILDMGLIQAEALFQDAGAPPEERERLADALSSLGSFEPGLVRALKGEFHYAVNCMDYLVDGRMDLYDMLFLGVGKPYPWLKGMPLPGYFFQPNRTKRDFAFFYREAIANAHRLYKDVAWRDSEASRKKETGKPFYFYKPNSMGRTLNLLIIPACQKLVEWKSKAECGVNGARLMAACRAYREREGRLPDQLLDLAPDFLPFVPVDPYDGQPFRYARESGVVYSVGKDLLDSGGSSVVPEGVRQAGISSERWHTEDLVFFVGP
ncbi:MAG: hypothetical protein PHP44_11690 [Kiritimatiellae bacterium]|nr:hypothetical protein [Kiritimatiellia bacterium]